MAYMPYSMSRGFLTVVGVSMTLGGMKVCRQEHNETTLLGLHRFTDPNVLCDRVVCVDGLRC